MKEAEAMKAIRNAARKRSKARHQVRQATDELRVVCAQAKYAGVSISQIAREAELSRQGVYDLLGERPSP